MMKKFLKKVGMKTEIEWSVINLNSPKLNYKKV